MAAIELPPRYVFDISPDGRHFAAWYPNPSPDHPGLIEYDVWDLPTGTLVASAHQGDIPRSIIVPCCGLAPPDQTSQLYIPSERLEEVENRPWAQLDPETTLNLDTLAVRHQDPLPILKTFEVEVLSDARPYLDPRPAVDPTPPSAARPYAKAPHVSAGGKVLACLAGTFHLFDASTGADIGTLRLPPDSPEVKSWDFMALSPDGSICAVSVTWKGDPATRDVVIWKEGHTWPWRKLRQPADAASVVHFSRDGNRLFIGRHGRTDVWDLEQGRQVAELPTPPPNETSTMTRDGRRIIGLADIPSLKRMLGYGTPELEHQAPMRFGAWDSQTGELLTELDIPSKGSDVTLDRNHGLLLTSNDKCVEVWDAGPLMNASPRAEGR